MDEKQILEIIKSGETQTIEFKESTTKEIGKTICAFSNADGGTILLGVNDKGRIIGFDVRKLDEMQQQIYHSQQECSPAPVCSIHVIESQNNKVIAIRVPKFGSGVCYFKNEIYIRVGTSDHKIAGPSIEDFLKKRQVLSFEEEISYAKFTDLEYAKIKSYLSERNSSIAFEESKLKSILTTLKVGAGNGVFHLKNSAILLFSKNTADIIPQSVVKLVKFKGDIAVDIIDTTTLRGTLIENIDSSISFVLKNIKKEYKIEDVRRKEILEYPLTALREAIVNAIVHRDYFSPAATQINIFDNRIEITNPGALPRELKVNDIPVLGVGIPRNPAIYRLLSDINIVEGPGTGLPRMFNAMRTQGLPDPLLEDLGTMFKLTLYNSFSSTGRSDLNERQQRALGYIREHKIITTNKYQELYKVSKPTAVSDLKRLVKQKLIEKKGRGRATEYSIVKESLKI